MTDDEFRAMHNRAHMLFPLMDPEEIDAFIMDMKGYEGMSSKQVYEVLMCDEVGRAPLHVQNMLHPLFATGKPLSGKDPNDKETLDLEEWLDRQPQEEMPQDWEDEMLWYKETQGKL